MIHSPFSAAPRILTPHRICAVLSLAVGLGLSGCNDHTDVRSTVPANGQVNVGAGTKILVRFNSGFTATDDTSPEKLGRGMTVTGDKTADPYEGSVQVQTFQAALNPLDGPGLTGDGPVVNPPIAPGVPTRNTEDTMVFSLPEGETFKAGESISVQIHSNFDIRGNRVDSHRFGFVVLQPPPEPGSSPLRIVTTDPRDNSTAVDLQPRIAASFSQPVVPDTLDGNVIVQGQHSGAVVTPNVIQAKKDSNSNVLEVAVRLVGDQTFAPGEWVSLTFNRDIQSSVQPVIDIGDLLNDPTSLLNDPTSLLNGLDTPSGPAQLSPYNLRFQVTPGAIGEGGGWFPTGVIPAGNDILRVESSNLRSDIDGVEFAILMKSSVGCYFERQAGSGTWEAVIFDFQAGQTPVDLAVLDFDLDGKSEILVLTQGETSGELLFLQVNDVDELAGVLLPVDLPLTGLLGMEIADIDVNGGLDIVVYHETQTVRLDARDSTSDDSGDGDTGDGIPTAKVDTGDETVLGPGSLTVISRAPTTEIPDQLRMEILPILLEVERVLTADLDSDGKPDLLVEAVNGVHVYRNATGDDGDSDGVLTFQFARVLGNITGISTLDPTTWGVADLDGDRDVDIVAWDAGGALVYENTVFTPTPAVDPDNPVDPGDPDDGGNPDDGSGDNPDAEAAAPDNKVGLIFDDIRPTPNSTLNIANGIAAGRAPWFGDVNGDAFLDVLVVDQANSVVLLVGEESSLAFGSGTVFTVDGNGELLDFSLGDFDGDTGLDAVLISHDEESTLANDSMFQVFRTSGVVPVVVEPIASYRLAFCESGESPDVDDCVEDGQGVLADSLLEIPVLITAGETYSGYTLLLDYDDTLLEFIEYRNSSRFQREPTVSICSSVGSTNPCVGFVQVQVTSQQSERAQAPEAAGRGTDLSLGTFVLRPLAVSVPTTTLLALLQSADGSNDQTFETQVELVEGSERVPVTATADLTEFTVVVKPPLLSDVACEVGEIRVDDYDVTVSWTISADEADLVGQFEILDGAESIMLITDRFARQFTVPVDGTGNHTITLVVADSQGDELDRGECDVVSVRTFRPRVTCDFAPTTGDRGNMTITWSVLGNVTSYGVFKNGVEIRTISNVGGTEFVDFNGHVNDFYEVEARFGAAGGPRSACPDQNPTETLPPENLQIVLGERSSTADDYVVEASWNNREAYSQVHLDLFLEPEDETPFVSVDLGSGVSSHEFIDGRRGGMPPGKYRATIRGTSSGLESTVVSSNTLDALVPELDAATLICDLIEGDVHFTWTAWQGYSALELEAVDRGSGAVLRSEFVDPTISSFVFEDVIIAQEADFILRGEYSDFLPAGFDSDTETTCGADPVATLFFARAHAGLELRREIRIPIMADLPARLSGFAGTIELPTFFDPDSVEGDAAVSIVFNDEVVVLNGETTTQVTLADVGSGRQALSLDVGGIEVGAANGVNLGWVVGRIDWDAHGTEILGRYSLDVDSPFEMTFPTASGSDLVLQSSVRAGDDAPPPAELFVHGRYFSIEVVPVSGNLAAAPGDVVTVRVLLTQDDTQGPEGYQLEFLLFEALFDPNLLEALNLPNQSESVIDAGVKFPFVRGPEEGEEFGALGYFYFSTPGTPTLGAGIDQTVMLVDFRVLSSAANGQDFTPITFDFSNVLSPDEELDGNIPSDRASLVPGVAYNTAPPDDLPSVAFFDGGVRLQARTDLPIVESVSPTKGSLAGGNMITLRGANLDADGPPDENFPKVQFLDGGDVVLEVPFDAINVESSTSLTFAAPSAISQVGSIPSARTFDVRVLPRAGLESAIFESAYTFEPLAVKSTNVVSVTTAGGQQMTVSGTGFSPSTRVEFRIEGSPAYAVVDQDATPADGRSLTFRAPALPGEGDKFATIVVEVTDLGSVELSVPIRVDGESTVVPRVLSVDPTSGPESGGDQVQVNVSGFSSLVGAEVFFAERSATDVTPDAQGMFLTVTVPAAASAPGAVSVRVVVGAEEASAANLYTYAEVLIPEIVAVDPASGAIEGGNVVTIAFRGFDDATEPFEVRFGANVVDAADIVAERSTELDVIVPVAAAAGTVDVTLSAGVGFEATLVGAYEYVESRIVGIVPATGPSTGGNNALITVEDIFDLAQNPQVFVGGVEAVVDSVVNENGTAMINVTLPAVCAVGVVDVAVLSGDLTLTLPDAYTYDQSDLTLVSVSPTSVSECGGDTVTLSGTGFCADMTVRVGDTTVGDFALVDGGTVTLITSANAAGSQHTVSVSIDGSTFVDWVGTLEYAGQVFVRGDVDGSGQVDISDAEQLSEFIVGVTLDFSVLDALDVNDDGLINAGDLVRLTDHLFNGAAISAPHPEPGFDPDDPFDPIGACQ
jgi:hypothetical protein